MIALSSDTKFCRFAANRLNSHFVVELNKDQLRIDTTQEQRKTRFFLGFRKSHISLKPKCNQCQKAKIEDQKNNYNRCLIRQNLYMPTSPGLSVSLILLFTVISLKFKVNWCWIDFYDASLDLCVHELATESKYSIQTLRSKHTRMSYQHHNSARQHPWLGNMRRYSYNVCRK